MSFDINKPYRTRDGHEAKAIADPVGILHGWIQGNHICETRCWWRDGHVLATGTEHPHDLVNIPEKRTVKVWINCYEKGFCQLQLSRAEADSSYGAQCRIACIEREITFEVGEGL